MTQIYGAGGGRGGRGGSRSNAASTPDVDKDNLESTQYAKIVDLISEGEIQGLKNGLQSVFLDDTPVQNPDGSFNFRGLEIDLRYGTQWQTYMPLANDIEREVGVGVQFIEAGDSSTRSITDPTVDAVRITVSVPQLARLEQDGDQRGAEVRLQILVQYNGGGFNVAIDDLIKGRTTNLYQRDYLVNLNGAFPVEVKVLRISQSGDKTRADRNFVQYTNTFSWSAYTEITYAKLAYPNSALVGIRADASQFSSIPRRSYLIRGIKVSIPSNATVDGANGRLVYSGVWDGTFGAAQWTTDPAWILWDLLTSTRYGFGDHIQPSQLDKWAFFAASQYASELVPDGFGGTEPRFSCNVNIQTAEEAYKLTNDLSSVMRVMPYWGAGSVTISQDRREDTSYFFTLANVTEEGFSYQGASRKTRPTVCVVSYLDLEARDIAYESVEDADGISRYGVVQTEVNAFACTSQGQAHRIGEWLLYSERYESEVVNFTTSIDAGVVVRPGQVIEIADPVRAGARRGGRITAATATQITLDDATGLEVAGSFGLSVILPDGSAETRTVISIAGNVITVAPAYSATPNVNSIWVFQSLTLLPSQWRVLGVSERDGTQYEVTAIAYNPSKYAYIERGAPLNRRDITDLNVIYPAPKNLRATEVLYDAGGIAQSKLLISWDAVAGAPQYRVRWREADGNWNESTQTSPDFEIFNTSPGVYEIKVFTVSSNLQTSFDAASVTVQTQGKTAPPATPTGISLIPNSDTTAILSWDRATDLDVLLNGKVLIRHSTLLSGATWQESQDIVAAAAGSQTQKQVPMLQGTYLIKFEDDGGRRSADAAAAVVDLPTPQPRLLVQSYREDQETPPFSGNVTNMVYSSEQDGLILNLGEFIDDLATDGNWDGLGSIDGLSSSQGSGEYEFGSTYDFGGVFDVNLRRYFVTRPFQPGELWDDQQSLIDTWPSVDGDVLDQVNATLYVRATPDDPGASPTWGAWNELVNGITRGRAFQFKVVATSFSDAQNVVIDELGAEIELQQRTEFSGVLTSGTSSYVVTYAQPFYQAPAVGISAFNMATGDYYAVTGQSRTGFTITFYNSGASVISRNFSYNVVGYGREII